MTNATGRNDEGMKQRRNYRVSEKGEIKNITKKYIIGGRQNEKKKKTFTPPPSRALTKSKPIVLM